MSMKKKRVWSPVKYLFAAARRIWGWSPERRKVKKEAETKGGFQCSECKNVVERIHIDHIEPVVLPSEGFVSWDRYYQRLYTSASNLQALCEPCHKRKTKAESKERRERRKKK